ncbi:MAG: Gfo/Idh/MocA family oxidoreductase [Rikenellaceae bacterium]
MEKKGISRRDFISHCAIIGAATTAAGNLLTSCSSDSSSSSSSDTGYVPLVSDHPVYIPEVGDKAIDGKPIRAGLIGCGGRGTGAALNYLESGDNLSIVAMADIFEDRQQNSKAKIEEAQNAKIDDSKVYLGFEAYKKVCEDPDIDYIIVGSPSIFHSTHAKYALEQGKHVFCEKPAGIDPVSCRLMMSAITIAKARNLCLQMGTQRHHGRNYNEGYRRVREGYIGRITSAVLKWNQGSFFFQTRQPGWTDMEYMLRDFFSWNWLCGDHVIDQLVHQLDVFQWFAHLKPISVVGMGSQLQRQTGDIFDNFAMDIVYEGGVRVNAQARQINGCANDVSETIYGTKGVWSSKGHTIHDLDGNLIWKYDAEAETHTQNNPYVLEHMDVVNHIRSNKVRNSEAETCVVAAMVGAMSRESAYTGKELKYDEFAVSNLSLMLEKLHLGNIPNFEKSYVAPKMGEPAKNK